MKRWVSLCLLGLSLLSTGCAVSARYRYRDDYRYRHYDRDHYRYDGRGDYYYRR
jgi:hypothetical protein